MGIFEHYDESDPIRDFNEYVERNPLHCLEIEALRKLQRGAQIFYRGDAGLKTSPSKDEKKYLDYYYQETWEEFAQKFDKTVEEAKQEMLDAPDEIVDHRGETVSFHDLVYTTGQYTPIFYRENWLDEPTPLIWYSHVLKDDALSIYFRICEQYGITPR